MIIYFIYLEGRVTEINRDRDLPFSLDSANAHDSQDLVRLKVRVQNSIRAHLWLPGTQGHILKPETAVLTNHVSRSVPSQDTSQEARSESPTWHAGAHAAG